MGPRKERIESHVSESEFEPLDEFLVYLDNSVPDSMLEGQDVPEKEPDDGKQGEENKKTKKNDKNNNPNKRGRVESSPTKELALPLSPPKKRGRGRKP